MATLYELAGMSPMSMQQAYEEAVAEARKGALIVVPKTPAVVHFSPAGQGDCWCCQEGQTTGLLSDITCLLCLRMLAMTTWTEIRKHFDRDGEIFLREGGDGPSLVDPAAIRSLEPLCPYCHSGRVSMLMDRVGIAASFQWTCSDCDRVFDWVDMEGIVLDPRTQPTRTPAPNPFDPDAPKTARDDQP